MHGRKRRTAGAWRRRRRRAGRVRRTLAPDAGPTVGADVCAILHPILTVPTSTDPLPGAAADRGRDRPDAPDLPASSAASRWRTRLAAARPAWRDEVAALAASPITRETIVAAMTRERGDAWRDEAHLNAGLRALRAKVFAASLDRDLARLADVGDVMATSTALAEVAIDEALAFHARRLAVLHGVPRGGERGEPQDLMVVGMGKLGGGELNVSSDVDLVFVYGEDGETRADRPDPSVRPIANDTFFTRLGRSLIGSLADVTADGFVFRVDMRLRPDGDAGPLVTRFAMLERYLVGSARDWERFAWIKGRVVSRPVFGRDASGELERLIAPFVYRRYLDFGAIDALRQLHGQIRAEAARREGVRRSRSARGKADSGRIDVKLGRGGIREIEFVAQHFQLIRGGRMPQLRLRPTRATLERLVDDGLLDADVGARLRVAYDFLRDVEHRLQYLDDAQVHTLPSRDADDDRARVGAMCAPLVDADGKAPFDALVDALETQRRFVEAQFDAIFGDDDPRPADAATQDVWAAFVGPGANPGDAATQAPLLERLAAAGYVPPDAAFARLGGLARSARVRALSAAARRRLDALVPRLVAASSGTPDPNATLGRWFDLIEAIAGRSAYLALLDEYPAALVGVTRLLAASPWAAHYLTRHPLLLDELIDAPQSEHERRDGDAWSSYWRDVAADLDRRLTAASGDAERQMDVLREVHHAETFRLLIDDLGGRLPIESLSDQLSALADLVLDAAIAHGWAHFVAGRTGATSLPARPSFAVIAFGKLGGKELGYASDLDLVFLFDARREADPAEAAHRYARFAQRLNLWLTARTTAGALFDIDLRLRPDGAAGVVVSSFDAWSRYERRDRDTGAWTWEHQALTRARFSAGDREIGAAFEAERVAILTSRVLDDDGRARLRDEVVAMRRRMHDGHPNRSGLFDLKHDEGGMVDIEFAVQYLVLAYAAVDRRLVDNVGNIALLGRAADAGRIDRGDAERVADAYRLYRARQHAVRLADPNAGAARIAADACRDERDAVRRLWRSLFG